jgi:hypothetical protein
MTTAQHYLEHVVQANQRWDTLAFMYYGDAMRFGGLIAANPDVPLEPVLPLGVTLLVPIIAQVGPVQTLEVPPWM